MDSIEPSPDGGYGAGLVLHKADEGLDCGGASASELEIGTASDVRKLMPLLESIAKSLDKLWKEVRASGVPGEFARLDEASRSVHRSLVSLCEHFLERDEGAPFDKDVVVMSSERRHAIEKAPSERAINGPAALESMSMNRMRDMSPDGAA